jgi:hypothetical protein
MVSHHFSTQKGAQRQKSLNKFKAAMASCGEDLVGILNTRYGKTLKTQLSRSNEDAPAQKLVKVLGKVFELAPRSTRLQWLAVVQSCGFKRSALVKEFAWKISSASWARVPPPGSSQEGPSLPLPYTKKQPSTAPNSQPSTPNPSPAPIASPSVEAVEAMDVESPLTTIAPLPLSPHSKEGRTSRLLPYLQTFFEQLAFPCPHTNKKTMPYSVNSLWKMYNHKTDKPCTISPSCFQRIWKNYFRKNYLKARQRDGLCQLCEIGHKIEKIYENSTEIPKVEKKKIQMKKNVVLRHKLINKETKEQFQLLLDQLKVGQAILTIDFKENITLGRGPRELGQSWYSWERRTIFGMALLKWEMDGRISKWHFNLVSDCLTHDTIFVKVALAQLFASTVWQSFNIDKLAIWCDNAPHFRNKAFLAYLLDLIKDKDFSEVCLCFFEAYHGKSEVDSMFGTMTSWLNEWVKTRYLNTTEDVLNCFHENNSLLPNFRQNFFWKISIAPELWTQRGIKVVKNIRMKQYQYFHFSVKLGNNFQAMRYAFKSIGTTSGNIECTGLVKDMKQPMVIRLQPKKAPKYSKDMEVVNSSSLTASDEKYLEKKALAWGLRYKM